MMTRLFMEHWRLKSCLDGLWKNLEVSRKDGKKISAKQNFIGYVMKKCTQTFELLYWTFELLAGMDFSIFSNGHNFLSVCRILDFQISLESSWDIESNGLRILMIGRLKIGPNKGDSNWIKNSFVGY